MLKWTNVIKICVLVVVVISLAFGLAKPISNNIRLGLDLQGGTHLVLNLVDTPEAKVDEQARQGVMRIIDDRINQFGVTEPLIIPEGSNRIIVELPGLDDSEEAVRVIQMTAQLQFADREGRVWLTGKELKDAKFVYDDNKPVVSLEFDSQGAGKFAAATEANLGQPLFILLDEEVVTAPIVKSVIEDGRAIISGIESAEEAQRYAIALRSGALPVKVDVIENRTVGPTLGQDSIGKSKWAFLVGIAAVLLYMIIYYGVFGLIADFCLAVYVLLVLAVLASLKATLTLPGIAGFILSIGMAVDANVIIFERIKEERQNGKTIRSAVEAGFTRALTTVIDSNITTLIAAGVLYYLGTGPIRGFAVTLGLGIIASMISAVVVAKYILRLAVNIGLSVDVRPPGVFGNIKLDVVGKTRIWFAISCIVIAIGIVAFVTHGGLNSGIDFQGGTLMQLQFDQPASLEQVRSVLTAFELEKSPLQQTGEDTVLIRTKELNDETRRELLGALEEKVGSYQALRVEKVGAVVSAELKKNAFLALTVAAILMLIYIALRFEMKFALAGVLALIHDVVITVGVFSILNIEIDNTFVAAILTIVGYSINDTIVIFDRLRENMKTTRKGSLGDVVDQSISETLTRSMNTVLTTLFTVVSLLVLGGETTKVFALALLIGLLAGTYSSIFIASPLWRLLHSRG